MKSIIPLFILAFFSSDLYSQYLPDTLMQKPWKAQWITAPGVAPMNEWIAANDASLKEFGVYKFRKSFVLNAKPATYVVHVSADNRYKLFVNEKLVSIGPARGDLYFWNFETVDIAPYLNDGKNTVAAIVWNAGKYKPEAQITYLTGFILQGEGASQMLNTNNTWKCIKDSSYHEMQPELPRYVYYVAGWGEMVNMQYNAKGWTQINYNDINWHNARMIGNGLTKDAAIDARGWMLVPSPLPQMEMTRQRLVKLRKATGVRISGNFPATKNPFTIAANTKATLLLDQTFLTNAYPSVIFSKGKNASITLTYAEAPYQSNDGTIDSINGKGNRNDIDGKIIIGKKDSIISDGSNDQEFTSLWWRTYRYIKISIQTKNEPLTIEDIYGTFTGYPFIKKSVYETTDTTDVSILNIGWRTARLCAFETYMDCPYYEQLQYIGDARIQALITLYNTSDDRLVRNALTLMDHSRIAEGITLSRYPTDLQQQISTFSLWWICMLHDYWMYRPDTSFIKDKLPGEREVLSFFQRYQQPDGSLKNVPYWLFTDWVDSDGWKGGAAPVSPAGYSAVLDLQLMITYQFAAEMEHTLGYQDIAACYNEKAMLLKETIQKKYWDSTKKLYADTEERKLFSQHTNSLAILAGMVSSDDAKALGEKILYDTALTQASIYFKFYVYQALVKAGLGNGYKEWLSIWKQNIKMGMTTWAEISDINNTRSDCHAWGSSPNIEYYRTVLGIDTDAPGFSKVKIEPHLGNLQHAVGTVPHPDGNIIVNYKKQNDNWIIHISLPDKITGRFIWNGKEYALQSGDNRFKL